VSGGVFSLRSLLHHPEVLAELRADRSLLPSAVNELLRYDYGPSDWLPRFAVRDFELEGRAIRKGQLLMLSFMGADRDPAVFPEPDRLDLRRDTSRLAIFGHGPHYCLGANLARQELRCMLDAALDFLPPGARLLDDRIRWSESIGPLFRRLESLPVAFTDPR
jgi:cytochrome P450